MLVGFFVHFIWRLYCYLQEREEAELGPVLQACIFIVWALLCVIANQRFQAHTPLLVFLLPIVFAIISNLQLRGYLPEVLTDRSYNYLQDNFELLLILCVCLNYTSYLSTMIIYPVIFVLWSYF